RVTDHASETHTDVPRTTQHVQGSAPEMLAEASREADLMVIGTRGRSPIRALLLETAADARIVSVYGRFDPHIPGGSALPGARNVVLDTMGHFRVLADPRILDELDTLTA
ncbi:MAG: universal stress protein, partial [Microbacterium sp.]